MTIDELQNLAEEERQFCLRFEHDPLLSNRYRELCRDIVIHQEDSNPKVRFVKSILTYLLAVAIPVVIWMWATIIHGTINLIIK